MPVENKLVEMENELKALKQTAPVSLGALEFPQSTPTQTYTGSIDTSSQNYVVARIEAKFTRSDGLQIAPMVDFAFDIAVSPTYQEYMASMGIEITGNDPNVMTEFYTTAYEASTSSDSVTYNIDVLNAIAPYAGATATITATVQAISTVNGTLTLTRTI